MEDYYDEFENEVEDVPFITKDKSRAERRKKTAAICVRRSRQAVSIHGFAPWWDEIGERPLSRPDAVVKKTQLHRWAKYSYSANPGWQHYYPCKEIEFRNHFEKADRKALRMEEAALLHEERFGNLEIA